MARLHQYQSRASVMTMSPSASRQPRSQGFVAGLFSVLALSLPLVAIFAPLAVAPFFAVVGTFTLAAAVIDRQRPTLRGDMVYLLCLGLIVWAALGWLWSINPQGTLKTLLQLGLLLAGLIILVDAAKRLDGAQARRVGGALAIGLAAALAVYIVERFFESPIQALFRPHQESAEALYSPFNRGLSLLFLFLPPAVVALRRSERPRLALALLAAALAVGFVYYGTSVKIGLLCGIAAALATLLRPSRMPAVIGGLIAAGILIAPLALSLTLNDRTIDRAAQRMDNFSAAHRLVIWHFVTERIAEKPLGGWGLDSSRAMPGGKDQRPILMRNVRPEHVSSGEKLPLHPHNMVLQWWLELGLVGAAIAAGILFTIFRRIGKLDAAPIEQALFAAQAAVAVGIGALSYGIWQSWWLATLGLAAMFSVAAAAIPARR